MKIFYRSTAIVVAIVALLPLTTTAQIQNSSAVAKFGIDGDLYSDYRLNGTFTAAGTHDWFRTSRGTGIGVIDIADAAALKAQLESGKNISFTRGSSIPRFSIVDTFLHLDAVYGRDYNNNDKTCFTNGSKNGDNPSIWATVPGGGLVQDKSDIIDAYASMRRDGTSININNPSHLILNMGSSILGTTGARYVDFELFVNRLSYDTTTGIFTTLAAAAKGGHEDFQFNADGSLKKIGDVDISITYSNTTVTDISIYIWVSITTYQNTFGQQKFNFVPGEFYGAGSGASWGYAKIVAKPSNTLPLWGSVNSATITGPAWGTASKDLGAANNNYYFLSNATGQFSETAVDLTSIGIDAAFNNTAGNTCSPPFTQIMIKTRSSASFTSALVDFSGPYTFLGIPPVSANILTPQTLTCARTSVTLSPATIDNGRYYTWTTAEGNIVGRPDTSVITITKPGKYYLTAYASPGCPQNKDSVIIGLDNHKPVARAQSFGVLNEDFSNTAQLLGGDTALSNYATPYGGSLGLLWDWSSATGFTSTIQNPLTSDSGWHQLIVTEKRNGCKDTARVYVLWRTIILSVKFAGISAVPLANKTVKIKWAVANETGDEKYELERSEKGQIFTKVVAVSSTGLSGNAVYTFSDNTSNLSSPTIYYRIKLIGAAGKFIYSPIIKTGGNNETGDNSIVNILQNNTGSVKINYFTKNSQHVTIRIADLTGRVLAKATIRSADGSNTHEFRNIMSTVKTQVLMVQLIAGNEIYTRKIITL
ncbi:MAG: hypothetical protein V4685_05030 [Bacteroidota bacterium]